MIKKSYQIDMINGPLVSKIILFTIPLMLSSVLQLMFNAADIVVVGRFAGSNALGAVGSTSALIQLIINLFIGLSVGANVVVARYSGANDYDSVHKTIHTSMLISLVGGIILAFFGFFASQTLLIWMKSPADIIDLSTLYMKIYFLGMPASMIYNFGTAILRARGDTKRPLYYLFLAGVINVLLNLVFVIVFKMHVAGVALATIISQYISAVLIVICMSNEEGHLKFNYRKMFIDKKCLWEITKIGLPAGLQGTVFSLSNVVIQSAVNSFGSVVMAGSSAAANIEGFVYAAMNALYQACLTFTGQNIGAKKYDRVLKSVYICVGIVIVVGLVLGFGATFFGESLMSIYSPDQLVISAGVERLKIICTLYFLCGIMDVMVGALRGIGYSIMPMIVSILGACGFRLLWVQTYFQAHRTTSVLFASYPISWFITGAVHILCFIVAFSLFKKRKRLEEKTNSGLVL